MQSNIARTYVRTTASIN